MQAIEIPLRGMEIALSSFTSLPTAIADDELGDALQRVTLNTSLRLEQAKCSQPLASTTVPNSTGKFLDKPLQALKTISPAHAAPSAFFFLSCMQLLQDGLPSPQNPEPISNIGHKSNTEESRNSKKPVTYSFKMMWSSWNMSLASGRLVFAFKCSLSLGLAVLFGLMYNKENAYWSGLTIAISFATGRQAMFTVANARAQGTAMGSVFGILGCFVFQSSMVIRFLLLLPWIIFASFLMHSRMYGQAGGISAVIGALLILGRKNYGSPSEFAIARITEAFIGLSCFIVVEILLRPRRAATLAKIQLSQSLATLQECIKEMVVCVGQTDSPDFVLPAMREKQNKLKMNVNELNKFIGEAKLEPNFWFLPFQGACYSKLWEPLSKVEDLLLFVAHNIDFLLQASQKFEVSWKEIQKNIHSDLELFKETVASSLKYLVKITSIESLTLLEKELQKKIIAHDLELGRPPNAHWVWSTDDEEIEKILASFLQHSEEIINEIHTNKDKEELKSQMVLSLGALGFCMGSLMRETRKIEKGIQELVQWENPSSYIDFSEISCKINALYV